MKRPFLPYGKQTITDLDVAAVANALREPLLTTGPLVSEFERAFAFQLGVRHAVACSSGTAALHLAAMALDLGPHDTVLAPTMSFVASANGPHYTGARVVFMDCDATTGLVTPETFHSALQRTEKSVRAAVIVHLNGEVADMAAISQIAKSRGIALIEDACHAIGTRHAVKNGEMAQSGDCHYSELACFSLHPVKTITMGEGGVVTTNSEKLAERMRLMRSHGISRDPGSYLDNGLARDDSGATNPWYYEMMKPGFNYRATDFACALGLSQLGQLERFVARRKALKARYDDLLNDFDPRVRPVPTRQSCDPCRHLYPVLIDFQAVGASRAVIMKRLEKQGIGTQVHYIPAHRQPYYRALNPDLVLAGAESYYGRTLSLPLFPLMADEDTDRVAAALRAAIS